MKIISFLHILSLPFVSQSSASLLDSIDTSERHIKWVDHQPSGTFRVNVKVNNIDFQNVPVDTGSTGFLLPARDLHYDNETELRKCCESAFEYLSSSNLYYQGYWLHSTVVFTSVTDKSFSSNITVLAVTETGKCSNEGKIDDTNPCIREKQIFWPTGIPQYMGIGFGRWSSEQPNATACRNPVLNVDYGVDKTLKQGYVINEQGITLGVRDSEIANENWALTKLTRKSNPSPPTGRPEWNGTPMCVKVAGSGCNYGTVLFDTGINYRFLGVDRDITKGLTDRCGNRTFLTGGTHLEMDVAAMHGNVTNILLNVVQSKCETKATPDSVGLVASHPDGAFVNTGRSFFDQYSLLLNDASGIVGLKTAPRKSRMEGDTSNQAQIPVGEDL